MLVLTRKAGQRILVGDNIAITIVRIDGNRIRIGIEAPADVAIQREELVCEEGELRNVPVLAGC